MSISVSGPSGGDRRSDGCADQILKNLERLRKSGGDLGKWIYLFCRYLGYENPGSDALDQGWPLKWYAALHDYMAREGLLLAEATA